MTRRKDITEDTYKGLGFKRQDLTNFFHSKGKDFDFGMPPMFLDSENLEYQSKNTSNTIQDTSETALPTTRLAESDPIEWAKSFAGRTAALEIIGAIAKILAEKTGNKYQHGKNISANAIAEDVVNMMSTINKDKSPENYRKLISDALKISELVAED